MIIVLSLSFLIACSSISYAYRLELFDLLFKPARRVSCGSDSQARLRDIGYAWWFPMSDSDAQKAGVTVHDSNKSYPGSNLYLSDANSTVILMGNNGSVIHEWSVERNLTPWDYAHLEGEYMYVVSYALLKFDRDSKIIMELPSEFHHDMDLSGGDIYVPSIERRRFLGLPLPLPSYWDNGLIIMAPDGQVKRNVSFINLFLDKDPGASRMKILSRMFVWYVRPILLRSLDMHLWDAVLEQPSIDLFHVNSVEVLSQDIPGVSRKGDVLVSMKHLDAVAIINVEREEVLWMWGMDDLSGPHNPTLLSNGNIMLFDNGVWGECSRVIEVDPKSNEIVWEYKGDPPTSFHSPVMGGVQELGNGNLLITESTKGRAFEITRDKEVVWEFWNPVTHNKSRSTIYRMTRYRLGGIEDFNG
ncbi:arylsulfotransferase family protein [Candidatus Altiarchaeota archaeon]